jgi:osomolarity two-component system response regulator SKN7
MNDVLAKPFTREGMVRILKKHLTKLLKNPPPPGSAGDDMASPGVQHGPNASYANAMAAQAQMTMQQQIAANNAAAAAAAQQQQQAHMQAAAHNHQHLHHHHQQQQQQMQAPGAGAGPQVKFEGTPMPSPTTTSSWHSPSQQMNHNASPTMDGVGGGGGGGYLSAVGSGPMALTPGGTQRPPPQQYMNQGGQVLPQIGTPSMGRMPDVMGGGDDRPDKRQRLAYGQPQQGQYSQ